MRGAEQKGGGGGRSEERPSGRYEGGEASRGARWHSLALVAAEFSRSRSCVPLAGEAEALLRYMLLAEGAVLARALASSAPAVRRPLPSGRTATVASAKGFLLARSRVMRRVARGGGGSRRGGSGCSHAPDCSCLLARWYGLSRHR